MAAGRHLGKFQMAISPEGVVRSTSCLILGWGFRGPRIEWTYFLLDQIQHGGWPPSWKISNGHISGTGHPIHFVFDSRVGFSRSSTRRIEWRYFRLDQIQDHGRQPSCIILNGHISETVHPVLFVFGSSLR